jgi:hypothetical protein
MGRLVVGGRTTGWVVLGVMLQGLVVSQVSAKTQARVVRRPAVVRQPVLPWPRPDVLALGLKAYECASSAGLVTPGLLTLIDYTLPSTERRLWVIDVAAKRVVFNELVAHGVATGENYAARFSNEPGSRRSSLGLFRTEDTYQGAHGESLRLSGLEPSINDRAMERAIVMHGAHYVSRAVIAEQGELGRSWGCPALERGVHRRVIGRIKGGTALFAYYPESRWLRTSRFLRCEERLTENGARPEAPTGGGRVTPRRTRENATSRPVGAARRRDAG